MRTTGFLEQSYYFFKKGHCEACDSKFIPFQTFRGKMWAKDQDIFIAVVKNSIAHAKSESSDLVEYKKNLFHKLTMVNMNKGCRL